MKKTLFATGLSVLMAALVACGGSAAPAATTAAPAASEKPAESTAAAETFEKAKVRVGYMPNMGSASLVVTARDKGFFEEVGIEVELVEFQGGPAEISAMASGDIDVSQIGHGAHALAAEGKALIFQIDGTSLADAVIGNKEKGVSSIEDLKGKTVAVTSGTSAEIILKLVLETKGMTTDDVELVEMDANGIVSAMLGGNVDACATWSPGTVKILTALGDNGVKLGDNSDYLDKVTFPGSFITTQAYLDGNRDVLVRFTRALQKAGDYRKEHIEEVAALVAKQVEVPAETMLETINEGNWLTGEFVGPALADGTIKNYYENQQKVFLNSGRLKEEVPVEKYVLFDIMEEAFKANHK